MQNIKIQEIADELGMQSNELVKRVKLLYKNIKSSKSRVTPEVAKEIFDSLIYDKDNILATHQTVSNLKNINLYFSSEKIDIRMLKKIASTYKQETQKEFIIRSFNFSELSIVKLLVAGLSNLDIKKYIKMKSSNKELDALIKNMNLILDDVDFENIDDENPLNDFENYIYKHKPEVVYIEGVDYHNIEQYEKEFSLIGLLAKKGIKFEIGFINIDQNSFHPISRIEKLFCIKNDIMNIKDIVKLKENKIVETEGLISNISTKITRDGATYYSLDISDGVNKIEVWISPLYFEQEMKVYEPKPVGTKISRAINDTLDLDELTKTPSKVKLWCVLWTDNLTMLYYIFNIEQL